MIKRRRCI